MEPQPVEPSSGGPSKKLILTVAAVVILGGAGWFLSRGGVGIMAPAGIDVDRNLDGSATYSNEEGSVTVGGNRYPDNWPSDAPKYAGAQIQYSGSSNPQSGSIGSAVVFTTPDSADKVVEFYKNELSSNGWVIEQTASISGMMIVVANKGESTFSAQIVSAEDGQTTVTIGIEN